MLHNYVPTDCNLCPRLAEFRSENSKQFPDKFNKPVPSFGAENPELLIVGLAPGLKGANFTGRPFTGDHAGDTLYSTLQKFDFAVGDYQKTIDDNLTLNNCRITNAVRCVPPQNKPIGTEINTCGSFLKQEITEISNLKIILALGSIAHNSILRCFDLRLADYKFGHCHEHQLPTEHLLIDSYHCSRYNINTNRLTQDMFDSVFKRVKSLLA